MATIVSASPAPLPSSSSNNGYFDLAGVFKVQDKYITDLGNSYPNVNNAPQIVGYVADLQNQMTSLAQQYQAANTSSNAILDHQNQMIGIVDAEQQRLNEKKALIEQAKFQQQREALLNNSYRLKYAEYTKIVIVIIAALLVFLLIQFLSNTFAYVPSGIVILLHIANLLVAFSIIIYIYAVIYSRDKVNFNELNLPAPLTDGSGVFVPAAQDSSGSSFWGSLGLCYEQSCCGQGTAWDPNSMMCLAQQASGPVPVNTSGITGAPIIPSPSPSPSTTATPTPTITFSPNPSPTFTSMTSAAPTTRSPTTLAPTTPVPTTPVPTTPAPTTPAPTTPVPTTPAPTTPAPTTPAPTTKAPTTPAPTTKAPTTPTPSNTVSAFIRNQMNQANQSAFNFVNQIANTSQQSSNYQPVYQGQGTGGLSFGF